MRQVGIAEAESGLSTLIDLVGQGEAVTITRDGTPVAVLIPASQRSNKDTARAAVARLRARAETAKLGPFDWEEWKTLRDQGRP